MNLIGILLALIAFSIVFNRRKLVDNREKIIGRVVNSTDQERVFVGIMTFLLGLGFLLASL